MLYDRIDQQGQRLLWVLSSLNVTPYKFSKDLGYKSPDTIYHIINGKNQMSNGFLEKVGKSTYKINPEWLKTGRGEEFIYSIDKGDYGREFAFDGKLLYPARLPFYMLNTIAKKFANVLFHSPELTSYRAKVKVSAIEGLEFKFEQFDIFEDQVYDDKYYIVILKPDWTIGLCFDYWRVDLPTRRCQDILKISDSYEQAFTNALYIILKDVESNPHVFDAIPFLEIDDKFKELYRTDSR